MNTKVLSPKRRDLVNEIRKMNFGVIENLIVKDGEPLLPPGPFRVTDIKFGAKSKVDATLEGPEGELKEPFVELFRELDRRKNFRIRSLEVQDKLPFRMKAEGEAM